MDVEGQPIDFFSTIDVANPLLAVESILGSANILSRCPGWYGVHPIVRVYCGRKIDTETIRHRVRCTLDALGWVLVATGEECEDPELSIFGIAPIRRRIVSVAYHATRTCVVPAIMTVGLLPSNADRRATTFLDTDGVIHVCEELGVDSNDIGSARWWGVHLSDNNRFGDRNWNILRLDMRELDARVYCDIHSESGLVVDRIANVPPDRISLVNRD